MTSKVVVSPQGPSLSKLSGLLREMGQELEDSAVVSSGQRLSQERVPGVDSSVPRAWPQQQLRLCAEFGVFSWFIPKEYGGLGWSGDDVVRGYLQLSAACLTTSFVITQRVAAIQRIITSNNDELKSKLLPKLATGELSATVGISHLTTSRRHLKKPVLRAVKNSTGYKIDGFSPWGTGGFAADYVVMGAVVVDEDDAGTENQLLFALPTQREGVSIPEGQSLVGLSASQTGPVHCDGVQIDPSDLLLPPMPSVLTADVGRAVGTGSGGLQTSSLALGLATEAIQFIQTQSKGRPELQDAGPALAQQLETVRESLLRLAAGDPDCDRQQLRADANSLVLRATQSALVAAKGAGFVSGHPAGRWCREALFFLVWSCPQPVLDASLCELVGTQGA